MADPKTKNGTNGVVNGKSTSKPSKLFEAIRGMLHSAESVKTEIGSLKDFEELVESEKKLRKEVEDKTNQIDQIKKQNDEEIQKVRGEKDEEIVKLKAELEAEKLARTLLIEGFEKRAEAHNQVKADGVVASQQLAEAQQTLRVKQIEVEAAQRRVSDVQKSSTRLEGELKTARNEKDKIVRDQAIVAADLRTKEAQLAKASADYTQLRQDVGQDLLKDYNLQDFDNFQREVDKFAEQCRALVKECFSSTDSSLSNVDLPQQLEYLKGVPLPKSGSSPELRRVVAQVVIARFLRTHIFQPFFLPPEQHGAGHEIFDYLSEDVQRATIFRCQILAVCERHNTGPVVAKKAVDEVYKTLCALVPATQYVPLQGRLKELFAAALEMWDGLQRSRQLILCEELDIDEDEEDDDDDDIDEGQRPREWDEYGERPKARSVVGNGGEIVATLFPQVIAETDDDDIHVIYPGVALWSDQAVVVAANQARARSPVNGRVNGDGARGQTARRRSASTASAARA